MLKKAARKIVLVISWAFVHQYIRKFKPITIGVTGSVGKTGTKRAIAHVISSERSVAWQDGNYNDIVTVPLIFFGLDAPSLFNPIAWLATYVKMFLILLRRNGSEVVVLELGTDGPGQIAKFSRYLKLDFAVITAISHEHMEYFKTLNAVADEELAVIEYANKTFVSENVASSGLVSKETINDLVIYGEGASCQVMYAYGNDNLEINSSNLNIRSTPKLAGTYQFASLAVASEIAAELGITSENIISSISTLQSMPGRMNILPGINDSLIIDDTYNSSPIAVKGALEYLYALPQKNKIAVLGNMNEMGDLSKTLHEELADYCDDKNLTLLITIGKDINKYLVPLTKAKAIETVAMDSPYDIGDFLVKNKLQDTAVLFKGSQNGVFLEEAIKSVLANQDDSNKLVRQSDAWLKKKQKQFGRVES